MLDAYIIDAIRREELEREQDFERRRVWLEIPVERERVPPRPTFQRDEIDSHDPVVIPLISPPDDPEENAA